VVEEMIGREILIQTGALQQAVYTVRYSLVLTFATIIAVLDQSAQALQSKVHNKLRFAYFICKHATIKLHVANKVKMFHLKKQFFSLFIFLGTTLQKIERPSVL
jgi:hypothetical protein